MFYTERNKAMGEKTKIGWTDTTWNPVTGCTKIAAGFGKVICHEGELGRPLHWKKPRRVFVNSMSDLFHEDVPFTFVLAVMGVALVTPWHTYQILTKRPGRAAKFYKWWMTEATRRHYLDLQVAMALDALHELGLKWDGKTATEWAEKHWDQTRRGCCDGPIPWPPPNIWHGTSVSTQEDANQSIPVLVEIPAAVRFLSIEPLLEEIDFRFVWDDDQMICRQCEHVAKAGDPFEYDSDTPDSPEEWAICPKCGGTNSGGFPSYAPAGVVPVADRPFPSVDWVIVGAESGPNRRSCNIDWVRSIRDQCREAGVPLFVKQLDIGGKLVVDVEQFPADLRIQEFPETRKP